MTTAKPLPTHTLLKSMLSLTGGDPDVWAQLRERVGDFNALSHFEHIAVPWLSAQGRLGTTTPILSGMWRKCWVRNQWLLATRERAMATLSAGGIDVLAFKGAGLLGRLLPQGGLRGLGDVDLWVRPSQHASAIAIYQRVHGGELDLHRVPSHGDVLRRRSLAAQEALFESAWQSRTRDGLATGDLLYWSFLNPLFAHPAGESRAAFLLFEWAMVLRNNAIDAVDLSRMRQRMHDDDTVSVFLEHQQWLGTGMDSRLEDCIQTLLAQRVTARHLQQVRWIQAMAACDVESDLLVQQQLRRQAHLGRQGLSAKTLAILATFTSLSRAIKHEPGRFLVWFGRRRSWKRLFDFLRDIVRQPGSPA